jgi:hypothetical protein
VFATTYNVQIIDDQGSVVTQNTYLGGDGGTDTLDDNAGAGRSVKMLLLNKTILDSGYCVQEIEVFGKRQSVSGAVSPEIPFGDLHLEQNYPNPFNPSTVLRYNVPSAGTVSLRVYNVLGQVVEELLNARQNAGWHQLKWTTQLSSGVYLISLQTNDGTRTSRCVLLK